MTTLIGPAHDKDGITIYNDDCFNLSDKIKDVDIVITDPPYGMTACKWDKNLDLEKMWEFLKGCTKKNATYIFTSSQPFTSKLILSNLDMFKYELIWEKEQGSMPMNSPYQPIKCHENICVFSSLASTFSRNGPSHIMKYFPIMGDGEPYSARVRKGGKITFHSDPSGDHFNDNKGKRFPRSVLKINTERGLHPTQKPVKLFEWLIQTYTDGNDLILDPFVGSGTTLVAAKNLGRKAIGVEMSKEYCDIAIGRCTTLTNKAP